MRNFDELLENFFSSPIAVQLLSSLTRSYSFSRFADKTSHIVAKWSRRNFQILTIRLKMAKFICEFPLASASEEKKKLTVKLERRWWWEMLRIWWDGSGLNELMMPNERMASWDVDFILLFSALERQTIRCDTCKKILRAQEERKYFVMQNCVKYKCENYVNTIC